MHLQTTVCTYKLLQTSISTHRPLHSVFYIPIRPYPSRLPLPDKKFCIVYKSRTYCLTSAALKLLPFVLSLPSPLKFSSPYSIPPHFPALTPLPLPSPLTRFSGPRRCTQRSRAGAARTSSKKLKKGLVYIIYNTLYTLLFIFCLHSKSILFK